MSFHKDKKYKFFEKKKLEEGEFLVYGWAGGKKRCLKIFKTVIKQSHFFTGLYNGNSFLNR